MIVGPASNCVGHAALRVAPGLAPSVCAYSTINAISVALLCLKFDKAE